MTDSPVAAVIPALDEAENLPGLVADLRAHGIDPIVVVDNGSTDGTAAVARKLGVTILHEPRKGYGSACLAGIRHLAASPSPPPVLLFLDADRSDDPAAIPRLVNPVARGEADLVVGVRQGRGDAPSRQRGGTRLVLAAARVLHDVRIADLGPFRAISRDALHRLQMDDPDWGWTLQMQLRAHRAGLRVHEIPVVRRPRAGGRSKISGRWRMSLLVGMRMFQALVRERGWHPPGARG